MQDKIIQEKLSFENSENKDKYYLALNKILPNNPYFKAKLFEFFDYDIKRTFNVDFDDLKRFSETYENISIPRNFLKDLKETNPDEIYSSIQKKGTKYLTFEDEKFPPLLKEMEDFPLLLFYKGSIDGINFDKTLGIVGSRNATESAKQNVRKLVSGFLNTDVVIVSGLAAGIDTSAHRSALENNLKTIGVIGSGLDYIYPKTNKDLYEKIENGCGVIFSEFQDEISPVPYNFPQRNRIITALSKGVIIAEARMKSGAMISAKTAIEQGRELMCIPGLITNPNCEGIYHLIKNGASIVTETGDILNILNWQITPENTDVPKLKGLEKRLYEIISSEEISIEGLKQKLDIGINELMVKLTEMELSGLIIQRNGLYYVLGN